MLFLNDRQQLSTIFLIIAVFVSVLRHMELIFSLFNEMLMKTERLLLVRITWTEQHCGRCGPSGPRSAVVEPAPSPPDICSFGPAQMIR